MSSACEVLRASELQSGMGERKVPTRKDIRQASSKQCQYPAEYWSTLESRFHEILRDYTLERDSEDIRCQWLKSVRDTLKTAWDQHRASVSMGDAWAIRALVKAERPVAQIERTEPEILKLEPQKENA